MTRTFAVGVAWPLEQTGYSAMLHFIRATMQETRTEACKRPSDRAKGSSYGTGDVDGAWRTTNCSCNERYEQHKGQRYER